MEVVAAAAAVPAAAADKAAEAPTAAALVAAGPRWRRGRSGAMPARVMAGAVPVVVGRDFRGRGGKGRGGGGQSSVNLQQLGTWP